MSGHPPGGNRQARLTVAVRAGATGAALYRAVFGAPALPPAPARLDILGEGDRTGRRLVRGCPWTTVGMAAAQSEGFPQTAAWRGFA